MTYIRMVFMMDLSPNAGNTSGTGADEVKPFSPHTGRLTLWNPKHIMIGVSKSPLLPHVPRPYGCWQCENSHCVMYFSFFTIRLKKEKRQEVRLLFHIESCRWLKLTRSLIHWWHPCGKERKATWSRLLRISILHREVALPQCCVTVSNLMLPHQKKKIQTHTHRHKRSKQWLPHQVSVRCVLLTYMCHSLFCGTWFTKHCY